MALDPSWPCCPNPTHGVTPVPLLWVEVESKEPGKDEVKDQHGEFIRGPQTKYVCRRCGYGEVYVRAHKEYREAAEAERNGETLLTWTWDA